MEDLVVYVHQVQKVALVKMAKMVLLDYPVAQELVEDQENEESQDHKEKMVSPVNLVWRVRQEELDLVETKVKREKLLLSRQKVIKESQVKMAIKVSQVKMVVRELMVSLVNKVRWEIEVNRENQVHLEMMVPEDQLVNVVFQDYLESME